MGFKAPAVQRMHVDCVSVFETALRNSSHQCKYELMSNGVCISAVSAGLELYGTADWLSELFSSFQIDTLSGTCMLGCHSLVLDEAAKAGAESDLSCMHQHQCIIL